MALAARNPEPKTAGALMAVLRDADWLTPQRARDYARMLAGICLLAALVWTGLAIAHKGLDPMGKPLGADYPSFWAASRLALDHMPGAAYDLPIHWAVQRAAFSGAPVGYSAFFYPPPYLLACLPLALLPYLPSLAAFLATTATLAAAALRPLIPDRGALLALVAFPALLGNAAHGQNAFLTTALFTAAMLGARDRPILSGLALGLLVIKPHLALVLPLALLVTGNWRMIAAAGVSVLALCGASYVVLGADAWTGFLQTSQMARQTLEQGLVGDEKMQSAFAAARLVGAPLALAWTLQVAATLGAAAAMVTGLKRTRDPTAQAAIAACAALLASPFLLDYDLMLSALPLLWLLREGRRTGFLPWEKTVMLCAFLLPLTSRLLAGNLHLPTAPFVLAALMWVVSRRAGGGLRVVA